MTERSLVSVPKPPAEVSAFGLPEEIVTPIMRAATPALARAALMVPRESLSILRAPYGNPDSDQDTYRHPREDTVRSSDEHTPGVVRLAGPRRELAVGDLWVPARVEGAAESLEVKIADQRLLSQERDRFAAGHDLGRGGLVLANAYGGIDIGHGDNVNESTEPLQTAEHLLLRAIVCRNARLKNLGETVVAGLFNIHLVELFGDDIATYLNNVNHILSGLSSIPEAARVQAGPAMLSGALVLGQELINKHEREIWMTSRVLKDPDLAEKVLDVDNVEGQRQAHAESANAGKKHFGSNRGIEIQLV